MTLGERDGAAAEAAPNAVPLDSTGVPGLDQVLGGGIQRGSLVILAGPPGGGKTILAHHMAFSAARAGRHTTILTAFSEPTNKLIAHMRPFAFFDPELLGQTLDVLSIQQLLRQGLDAAANEIIATVRASQAHLVILDGFRGVRETAAFPDEARRFIYEVSNRLSLLGITLVLTSEAVVRDAAFFLEATTADVLLGLAFDAVGARERRTLEVLKARGAAPLSGLHTLTIGGEGVTIFPRLEARVTRTAGINRSLSFAGEQVAAATGTAWHDRKPDEPIPTGVPGLDTLLDGGLVPGTSVLAVGERGAGKTLLGLQFALQSIRTGERSLFVGFRETADQLTRKARAFQWGQEFAEGIASGKISVLRTPPVELRADVLADHLLALLDTARARRLVVDEIGEFERELTTLGYANRSYDFLAALLEALRARGVTALFTDHWTAGRRSLLASEQDPAAELVETLLWLRYTPRSARSRRALTVVQTSLSSSVRGWHGVAIESPEGLTVLGPVAGALAQPQSGATADEYTSDCTDRTARRDPERPHGDQLEVRHDDTH